MRRSSMALAAVALPVGLALVLVPAARKTLRADEEPAAPIARAVRAARAGQAAPAPAEPPPPTLAGFSTTRIKLSGDSATSPLPDKRVARLTIDPALQKAADAVIRAQHVPEAAVVLMDVATGRILVYENHVEKGKARDLCVEASAPAASVFKIVTSASLIDNTGLTPDHRECYAGGEHGITRRELVRDPRRDRWCTTLSGALGRSINAVFARLALEELPPAKLEATAKALGFGAPLAFDVPVQPSKIALPEDPLGYARTAAGFWNTTLSPLHAAWLSATIARGGEPVRPTLVSEILDEQGKSIWSAPSGVAEARALDPKAAATVGAMMESTVSEGTSRRAFRDGHGRAFLPNVSVAGKTGTLTDGRAQRFYTWFTGFAPSRPVTTGDDTGSEQPSQVAIGVLVVNGAKWTIKANVLAREILRTYFASKHVPRISAPAVANHASTTPGTKHRRHRGS